MTSFNSLVMAVFPEDKQLHFHIMKHQRTMSEAFYYFIMVTEKGGQYSKDNTVQNSTVLEFGSTFHNICFFSV